MGAAAGAARAVQRSLGRRLARVRVTCGGSPAVTRWWQSWGRSKDAKRQARGGTGRLRSRAAPLARFRRRAGWRDGGGAVCLLRPERAGPERRRQRWPRRCRRPVARGDPSLPTRPAGAPARSPPPPHPPSCDRPVPTRREVGRWRPARSRARCPAGCSAPPLGRPLHARVRFLSAFTESAAGLVLRACERGAHADCGRCFARPGRRLWRGLLLVVADGCRYAVPLCKVRLAAGYTRSWRGE